jgi:hypothetical protein
MPMTTPFVPLTVSTSSASSSFDVFVDDQPSSITKHEQERTDHFASAASDPPTTTPVLTPAVAARPNTHRRLTLSRFPLLRKGSRELSRYPSAHAKGSNTTAPPSHTQTHLLSTLTPRASTSTLHSTHTSTVDGPAAHSSEEGDISTVAATAQRSARPDTMHQTSSRLLRMTDDERPYTRVGIFSLQPRPFRSSPRFVLWTAVLAEEAVRPTPNYPPPTNKMYFTCAGVHGGTSIPSNRRELLSNGICSRMVSNPSVVIIGGM